MPLRLDEDRCYDALVSRDRRFDGQFIAGITSTGIYCRASCPAPVRPKRANVRVFATAAAAQQAGFRSCKRCRPDGAPGSAEWDHRGDLVGRAMRLIERGEVDRAGVAGLAAQLHVSERHLNRLLKTELGAGPKALARAHRANLARILLETTSMPITEAAFASGFSSVRQFNDTIRAVYDRTPTQLRQKRAGAIHEATNGVGLRLWLPAREPIDATWMFGSLSGHGIPGVTEATEDKYRRTLRLESESALMTVFPGGDDPGVWAEFELSQLSQLAPAIAAIRRLFDLDADPTHIGEALARHPALARLQRLRPGVRVPGAVDGFEAAIGAIVGQQISVAGARTLLGRLVEQTSGSDPFGPAEGRSGSDPSRPFAVFPNAHELLEADLSEVGLTGRRIATIKALASAVAAGELNLDIGVDRHEARRRLLALPGIGPWTADVIAMRALGDPDVMLDTDLIIRRRLEALDITDTTMLAPWRSYAACTLWATRDMMESESP